MNVRARESGLTTLELMVTLAVSSLVVSGGISLFKTTGELSQTSRQRMRAAAHYRDAQAAVGRVLQGADIDTLTGFDAAGEATEPGFQQVTGFSSGAVEHGPVSVLKYVGKWTAVPGVGDVGHVVLEPAGGPSEVIAYEVVKDSFRVRQEGRNLVVHLEVCHRVAGPNRVVVGGETVVSLRN